MAYIFRVYLEGRMGFEKELGTVIAESATSCLTKHPKRSIVAMDVVNIARNWEVWQQLLRG